MSYLFVDSTYDLNLGLLDDGFNWLGIEKFKGQKASAIIQTESYKLLEKNNLKMRDLKGIITVNGPGFYTGLRLSEGLSDVFSFFGCKQYSFYSYEIPKWCGYETGLWFTKAYRGEYFIHQWGHDKVSQKLIAVKEIDTHIEDVKHFIHSEASLDQHSSSVLRDPIHTSDLILKHSFEIFTEVLNAEKKEPFYFRAPEDEFKVNP